MNKKRLTLLGAVALVALGTLVLVKYVGTAEDRALAGEELVEVLIVDRAVPAGTPAAELQQFLRVESVPVKVQAAGALAGIADAEGLVVGVDLVEGEQLTAGRLVDGAEFATSQARLGRGGGNVKVPEGLLEITIPLDPIRTVGGTVRPGDLVGVVGSFTLATPQAAEAAAGAGGEGGTEQSGFLLHKILVTNVQGVAVPQPVREASTEDRAPAPEGNLLVTLAVDAASAEKLVFASSYGDVWLALEPADADETRTQVRTPQNIYG